MQKNSITFLLIIFFTYNIFGQSNTCIIKGIAKNNSAETISIGDSLLSISKSGEFIYKTKISEPQKIPITYQDKQFEIFIEPGENLEINFDAKDFDNSIVFNGNSAREDKYLFEIANIYSRFIHYFQPNSSEWISLYSKDEQHFLSKLDSIKSIFNKTLTESLNNSSEVNSKFLFQSKNAIEYTFDWMILQYPHFHKNYSGEEASLNKKTQAYLESLNIDNPDLLDVDEYIDFTDAFLHSKVKEEFLNNNNLRNSDNRWLSAAFIVVERTFHKQIMLDFWRYHYLNYQIENNGIKNIEPFLDIFYKSCQLDELRQKTESFFDSELEKLKDHPVFTYKNIDGFSLNAHLFIPDGLKPDEVRPAIIYFHGGSWSEGKPDWQFGYSKLGFISVCIEYRTYDRYGTLPFGQIADAKSAIRWLRENWEEFHIDTNKIIASGNSAGGHLALCTAVLDTLDEPNENLSVSSKPNALVLTSAVYDVTEGVWFDELVKDKNILEKISPLENVRKGIPPALIFHGTADNYSSPYKYCKEFVNESKEVGNDVYFYPIENKGHFLWQYGEYWNIAEKAKNDFYKKLGYLN